MSIVALNQSTVDWFAYDSAAGLLSIHRSSSPNILQHMLPSVEQGTCLLASCAWHCGGFMVHLEVIIPPTYIDELPLIIT